MSYFLQTLIIIIIMNLLLLVAPYLSKKLDHVITTIFSLAFFLIITFRPLSVPDTIPYYDFFSQLEFYKFSLNFGRTYLGFENGFCNFSKIIFLVYPNFRFFLFVIGSVSFLLNFSALLRIKSFLFKSEYNLWYPLFLLYVPYFGFLYSGIILRAGIAIGFCLFSLYYLMRKKLTKSIVLLCLGLWFHNSALIFTIVLLLYKVPSNISNQQNFKISFLILILYYFRIFDLFIKIVLRIYNFITEKVSFLNFMNHYAADTINSSFRWAIFFILLIYVFSSYIFSKSNYLSIKKYQNMILPSMLITAMLGGLPVILRGSDYFLILLLPLFLGFLSGRNRKGGLSQKVIIFSSNDRLLLAGINVLISSIFYLLFLRVVSFI